MSTIAETILARLDALQSQVTKLQESLDNMAFEKEISAPIPEIAPTPKKLPLGQATKRKHRREIRAMKVFERAEDYASEHALTENTRRNYERVLTKILENPELLEYVVEQRNAGVLYRDMVIGAGALGIPGVPKTAGSLTHILPIACRFGLASRNKGRYVVNKEELYG